jgi:hypothetical protein
MRGCISKVRSSPSHILSTNIYKFLAFVTCATGSTLTLLDLLTS